MLPRRSTKKDTTTMLRNFFAREDRSVEGQTLVEYALIIALVSVALIAALGLMTGALNNVFTAIQTALNAAN